MMKDQPKDHVEQNRREQDRAANQLGAGFNSTHSKGGGKGAKLPPVPSDKSKDGSRN
ncbi:hypothetical protein [Burkholderia gladioli]|uniref:hypothetical protein n=1 Tax=Burkholderia gladioli TaxID=28095 RepID=UPI0034DABEF4